MHKRTKALQIPKEVKRRVFARDKGKCVLCGKWCDESNACCHFISRAQGGLGIEENIFTGCDACHTRYDNGAGRSETKDRLRAYFRTKYRDWNEKELVYRKW